MVRSARFFIEMFRPPRGCVAAMIVASCLGISGCTNLGLQGEQFQHDPALELGPQVRTPDRQTKPFAVTNKGLQIEKSFGIQ